jgi:hypothetical protein
MTTKCAAVFSFAQAKRHGMVPGVMAEGWRPMNALQQLIHDYLQDHPDENYSTIALRGGIPRQTVQALARRERARVTPRPASLEGLAKGMNMSLEVVRQAAGMSAGYGLGTAELADERMRLLVGTVGELDDERMEAVFRRARMLLEEQREEGDGRKKRATDHPLPCGGIGCVSRWRSSWLAYCANSSLACSALTIQSSSPVSLSWSTLQTSPGPIGSLTTRRTPCPLLPLDAFREGLPSRDGATLCSPADSCRTPVRTTWL